MGIYIFKSEVLLRLLEENPGEDFGKHIIPDAISKFHVQAFPFEGYWEDIGTISSFFKANLALTSPSSQFNLHDSKNPIYTRPRFLPPSQVESCQLKNTLLSDGCQVYGARMSRCVIGLRSVVRKGAVLDDVIMMGSDYFEDSEEGVRVFTSLPRGTPRLGIGEGCRIECAIIDKNARIGSKVVINSHKGMADFESENYVVKDGIVVIPKNAIIPDGTKIIC